MTEFGLALYTTKEHVNAIVPMVVEAEKGGLNYTWLWDSHLLSRDAYIALAACALNTESVKLGTSITPIVTRHPAAIANAACTLHELSGGRMVLGIGVGDSSARMLGLRPAKIEYFENAVKVIRDFTAGKEVGGYKMATATGSIPIYFFSTGKNMLLSAGRMADGVMINPGADMEFLKYAIGVVKEGAEAAGRDFSKIHIGSWSGFAVDYDKKKTIADVKPLLARTMLRSIPPEISKLTPELVQEAKKLYNYSYHMEADQRAKVLVPDHYAERFAICGTPDECAEKISSIEKVGVSSIHLVMMNSNKPEGIQRLVKDVIPRVSRKHA